MQWTENFDGKSRFQPKLHLESEDCYMFGNEQVLIELDKWVLCKKFNSL